MNEKTILRVLIALIIVPLSARASGGEHHEGIPWDTITYQTINVSIVLAALFYFSKKSVKDFFSNKRSAFVEAAKKATSVRERAEQEHLEVKVRLTKLESTASESVARARAEAADLRIALLSEAEALSEKMKRDAENAAKLEVERAKVALRKQLIEESLLLARKQLATTVSIEDQKRLQDDFINNIQVVQ